MDITEVALGAVESVRHLVTQKNQQLHVTVLDTPVLPLMADRARIHQVLSNLLGNAPGTHRREDASREVVSEADSITIVVTDSGCGIAAQDLASIFRPFTRGGRPTGDGGLGLGLWLAREIAVLHGGSIEAHSDGPSHRTTFRFRLPRR